MKLTKEEKFSLKKRIEKKTVEIESYLLDLNSFKPETFEEYEKDALKKAACERECEKISEAVVDLAIFLIRYLEIDYNEEDEKAFGVLLKKNIIDKVLYKKLHDLRGMRDNIAHKYGEVNDKIVFDSISDEIEKDANEFLDLIKIIIKEDNKDGISQI